VSGAVKRWFYAGARPNRVARVLNRGSAWMHALGVWPGRLVTLRVRGRRSGRPISFPLVMVEVAGERYLVSMLGERANWVHNLRAAGGAAVLLHGRREDVHLEEVEPAARPPILRRYLECAPGARPHMPVDRHASPEAFARIAAQSPVFRLPRSPVVAHRFLLAVLHSPVGRLLGGLCEVRFVGRVSGRDIALPVQCVRDGTRLVIYVGRAGSKHWWRNFRGGHAVEVRLGGVVHHGRGRVVDLDDPDRARAEQVYVRRHRKVGVRPTDPLVIVELAVDASA
jgi:deazaflavin-dependent oxidoreductase (nitroreductase family)